LSPIPYYYYLIDGIEPSAGDLWKLLPIILFSTNKMIILSHYGKIIKNMPSGSLGPVLEKYAIITGIVCLICLILTGLAATIPDDYQEMLMRQNLIN